MLPILPFVHGFYNVIVGIFLFYQGWIGLKIRRARRAASAFPLASIKRHRKIGPYLPFLASAGFLVGLLLIALGHLPLLAFPLHFFLGVSIVFLLFVQKKLGLRIRGPQSPLRKVHFLLGIFILAVYVIQAFIGLSLLL
ncbi:MAG: DUF4079 family protein [Candidatus Aminicenantales bacterium]